MYGEQSRFPPRSEAELRDAIGPRTSWRDTTG